MRPVVRPSSISSSSACASSSSSSPPCTAATRSASRPRRSSSWTSASTACASPSATSAASPRTALIAVRGEAAEVALGEAQAVLALVQDEDRRGRLADLVAAVQGGELDDDDAQALEELIELGLTTGRIRSVYGPEGE